MKKTLVQICNAEWEIREIKTSTIKKRLGYEADGYTDYDTQKIYVASDIHQHRKNVTIVHESGHVILDFLGVPSEMHEDIIRKGEHLIYELIQNFPMRYKE